MKVLFAGLGGIGQRHLRNLRALLGNAVEVHAYRVRGLSHTLTDQLQIAPDSDVEAQYNVRVHGDLDEALAVHPDAVFVCNPTSLHIPVAKKAAALGCNLLLEKPVSHNMDGVEDLMRIVRDKKLVGLVAYQLRFHPCVVRLKAILDAGLIGRILAARVEVGEFLPGWHRYEDYRQMYAARADLGGGVILTQIHEFDYLYWFFGLPRRVFTLGGHYSSLDIDVEDVASSNMEFFVADRPVVVHLHQDYVQRPPARGCMILGDAGKVLMDLRSASVQRFDDTGQLVERQDYAQFQRNQLFLDEMNHFLACVRGESQPLISLEEGAQSLRMALAARESLQTGNVVEIRP